MARPCLVMSQAHQLGAGVTGLQRLTTRWGQSFQSPWNRTSYSTRGHHGSIFSLGAKTAFSLCSSVQKEVRVTITTQRTGPLVTKLREEGPNCSYRGWEVGADRLGFWCYLGSP